jgi:hypothetical protein
MRRVFGYVLFILGMTFVFLSPFLAFYTVPRVEKAPTDVDQTVVSDGHATYFSAQKLATVGPAPVEAIERYKGQPQQSTDTVAVIDYQEHLFDRNTNNDIDFDTEVFAMDRKTGEAVNCCGETPKHSGLLLKFPFGTEKITYQLWDAGSDAAYPAKYADTETLNGVTVYRFHQETGDVQLGFLNLPSSVIGQGSGNVQTDRMYNASIDVWIEPTTGAIVKGHKHVVQWAELNGQRVLALADVDVTYNPPTVDKLTSDAKKNKQQLTLVGTILPIALPIIGIILAVIGVLLLRKPAGQPVPGAGSDEEPAKPAKTGAGAAAAGSASKREASKSEESKDGPKSFPAAPDDGGPESAATKTGDSAKPAEA